jgi:protein-tyrosine phosphatase
VKYAIQFLVIGAALLGNAIWHGSLFWLLLWPSVSFLLVAAAYFVLGPAIFGKRPVGTMSTVAVAILLPYLLLTWTSWHLLRLMSREDCYNELVPGLLIGRRPLARELPTHVSVIIDLTAEFPESCAVRSGRRYISFPILDGGAADGERFSALVGEIAESPEPTYIHCAQGHGRTGMLAAAVLVGKGLCATPDEAMAMIRSARPLAELNQAQVRFLRRISQLGLSTSPARAASSKGA